MRLLARCRVLKHFRQAHDLPRQLRLGRAGQDSGQQPRQSRIVAGRGGHAGLFGLAQDRRNSSVGVLDVIDRVLG